MFKANNKDTGITNTNVFMAFINVFVFKLKLYFPWVFDHTLLTNKVYYTVPFATTLYKVKTIEFE